MGSLTCLVNMSSTAPCITHANYLYSESRTEEGVNCSLPIANCNPPRLFHPGPAEAGYGLGCFDSSLLLSCLASPATPTTFFIKWSHRKEGLEVCQLLTALPEQLMQPGSHSFPAHTWAAFAAEEIRRMLHKLLSSPLSFSHCQVRSRDLLLITRCMKNVASKEH